MQAVGRVAGWRLTVPTDLVSSAVQAVRIGAAACVVADLSAAIDALPEEEARLGLPLNGTHRRGCPPDGIRNAAGLAGDVGARFRPPHRCKFM